MSVLTVAPEWPDSPSQPPLTKCSHEPLSPYSRSRTHHVEEFRENVAGVLSPHRLDPGSRDARGLMVFNSVDLGDVALCYKTYGMPMRVRHEPNESFFAIHFSLAGMLTVRSGRAEIRSDRQTAAIIDPDLRCDTAVGASHASLMLRVERSAVQAELHRLLGRPPAHRVRFAPSLNMATTQSLSWFAMLRALCADLDGPRGMSHPALHQPLQRLIIAQLLTTVQHSFSEQLAGHENVHLDAAEPRVIRRAEQIISDHCHELLTVGDVAEAVGISVRSLQNGFRRYLNTTPTDRLRRARLAGAHAELKAMDPSRVTVSRVAAKWGFRHLGRFSQSYRELFGESPSRTLRR